MKIMVKASYCNPVGVEFKGHGLYNVLLKVSRERQREMIRRWSVTSVSAALLLALVVQDLAGQAAPPASRPESEAELYIGSDSLQRRFFLPAFRFLFPLCGFRLTTSVAFEHVTNGSLEGRVDFWLGAGLEKSLGGASSLEASLNHMCRHLTSRTNPSVLDTNEVLAKLWTGTDAWRAAVGGGGFVGKNRAYRSLVTADLRAKRLWGTELSLEVGLKLVNGQRLYHDLELAAAVAEGVDLFVRNVRPYGLDPQTYLGLRFSSGGTSASFVDAYSFRLGVYPFFDGIKAVGDTTAWLRFFERPTSRLLISLAATIPVQRGNAFFGRSRPDRIIYPVAVEYERSLAGGLYATGYFRYRVDMPVDVAERFDGRLSAGLGLRNQRHFERLERPFRFEVFAGREFDRGTEAMARAGFNTTGRGVDAGLEFSGFLRPGDRDYRGDLFLEFGNSVRVRPFVAVEFFSLTPEEDPLKGKFLFGVTLFKWF